MKGTIQLSMNFLVTIIIALALLALGIILLRQFVDVTVDTQNELNQRTQERIAELLDQGQQIVIPFSSQTLKRGESYLFGVGVLNIEEESSFKLATALSGAFHSNDVEFLPAELAEHNPSSWVRFDREQFTLKKNEQQSRTVFVQIPKNAPSGTYIFNVVVYRNSDNSIYDAVRKIIIIVP